MNVEQVQGSGAVRKVLPEDPDDGTWQLQLGLACTGLVQFEDWRCELRLPPGYTVAPTGGGCEVTDDGGHYTVRPDNGVIQPGERASVAVTVHGGPAAPQAVQFYADPSGTHPYLLRTDTTAVQHPDGTSDTPEPHHWPGIGFMRHGRTAVAPWLDWAPPQLAAPLDIRIAGAGTTIEGIASTVRRAVNQGIARGGGPRRPAATVDGA